MKPACNLCAKHESDDCDNYDLRPKTLCFVPTDAAQQAEDAAADLAFDTRRELKESR
jgi:hypothetical protein